MLGGTMMVPSCLDSSIGRLILQAVIVIDVLRRAGANVVVASVADTLQVGRRFPGKSMTRLLHLLNLMHQYQAP